VNDPKQLLGIKGASETSSIWKLRIQLMKPITWIPLIWGVICGAAASGNFEWTFSNVLASLACMLMSGPLLAGYTQTINDFFDKEIDAINEPNRPIPSGKISIDLYKMPNLCRGPEPEISSIKSIRNIIIATLPFQTSELLFQPHCHFSWG